MGRSTIKKYRRKTMKNKSKGKKLHLKKNLKLKTKRRNVKKTQKRFQLKKNKTKRMKKIKKMKGGDEPMLTFPIRDNYKKDDGKFNAVAYMNAIQNYNKQQVAAMNVEDPTEEKEGDVYVVDASSCTNVDVSNNKNEMGGMEPDFLKFKFADTPHIYCYNFKDIKQDLNNIGNICCVWKKRDETAENNEEGWGTSCIVRNTYYLLRNVCDYINGGIELEKGEEVGTEGEDNYLCVWKSLINARTWISQDAIKKIDTNKCNKGTFVLHYQKDARGEKKRTLIGNLYNVFGVGMLHGQQPGEYIFDIDFVSDESTYNVCNTTDYILDSFTLLAHYEQIWRQFWIAPTLDDDETIDYVSDNDSFASPHGTPPNIFNIGNTETPPGTPPYVSNISTPTRRLNFDTPLSPNRTPERTPGRSIRSEIEQSEYSSYLIPNNHPLTIEDLNTVSMELETNESYHPPIVSIPNTDLNPQTDGFVYLSPGLIPHSAQMGNTYDNNSQGPMDISELEVDDNTQENNQQRVNRNLNSEINAEAVGPGPFPDIPSSTSQDNTNNELDNNPNSSWIMPPMPPMPHPRR